MNEYLLLNLVNILYFSLAMRIWNISDWRRALRGLLILLALTAVFDNVIVGLDIVAYDPAKILGITVGVAPVEDFAYAILAALLVPALWESIGGWITERRQRSGHTA